MRKIYLILGILLSLGLVFAVGCSGPNDNSNQVGNSNAVTGDVEFESILYSFGIGGLSILDTATDRYTKDMVCESPEDYDFSLSETDRRKISKALGQYGFMDLNEDYTENCTPGGECSVTTELEEATIRVKTEDTTKVVSWTNAYYDRDDPGYQDLRALAQVLQGIISDFEDREGIEQPDCFYL